MKFPIDCESKFVFVLAAFEVDHIAGGRANGTQNIKEVAEILRQRMKGSASFLEAILVALNDESGVSIDDIIAALGNLITAPLSVENSMMWHTRDFCCRLGAEIGKRTPRGK